MTLEELHEYIASQYGSESVHMFRQDPGIAIFKRTDNKKWFAATKDVDYRTLGLEKDGRVGIVNVKLDPLIVASLKTREGFRPAYHMNRDNWITILLDGSAEGEEIYTFLDMSFGNVGTKAKKA
ncbi:MmcQ/YjbR family DNA-binding protein [Olsenella uli]|uniref:MmcQ/YjbR family DNA-binding protein n=1 Tax=Olsenella uli TaxID=133926 RepID=UPI00044F8BC7|nr:MmcQ/YjbR family DNA-binding protein [Olsenella uli]EUB31354.1 YjbR protein [Olsenella uli MSTE5]